MPLHTSLHDASTDLEMETDLDWGKNSQIWIIRKSSFYSESYTAKRENERGAENITGNVVLYCSKNWFLFLILKYVCPFDKAITSGCCCATARCRRTRTCCRPRCRSAWSGSKEMFDGNFYVNLIMAGMIWEREIWEWYSRKYMIQATGYFVNLTIRCTTCVISTERHHLYLSTWGVLHILLAYLRYLKEQLSLYQTQ